MKKNHHNKGRKHSEEWNRKISLALKGRIISVEARNKTSKTLKKYFQTHSQTKSMLGKHLSKKAKKRIGDAHRGEKNPRWNGGKMKSGNRHILVLKPDHPFSNKYGYIPEHRLVMEKHLGRYLKPEEVVHHINNIFDDNHIENLKLFSNQSEHSKFHYYQGDYPIRGYKISS